MSSDHTDMHAINTKVVVSMEAPLCFQSFDTTCEKSQHVQHEHPTAANILCPLVPNHKYARPKEENEQPKLSEIPGKLGRTMNT